MYVYIYTICGSRHPLAILEHVPHGKGGMTVIGLLYDSSFHLFS